MRLDDGLWTAVAVLRVGGNLWLTNGASLYVAAARTNAIWAYGAYVGVTGLLSVASNCIVFPRSQPTNGGSVFMQVGSLWVQGGGAINALTQAGITVYAGAQGSCDACVEALIAGTLAQTGEATCDCHGHDHEHAHEHGESCGCHGHHEHKGHEGCGCH